VTSAKGWQEMFGFAFRQSRNAMVLLDERRIQLEVNGAYLKLVGLNRDEVVGRPVHELSPDGPVLSARDWAATIARGDFTGERELVRPDGTTVTVQWGAHPETVTGHRLVLLVALSTERWGRRFRREPNPEDDDASLTHREVEIVRLVALGHSSPEIADELGIAYDTVRTHVRNAMEKVGARSRAHLVARALGDGLVHD
jgi:PAS domain S-box-containing protein